MKLSAEEEATLLQKLPAKVGPAIIQGLKGKEGDTFLDDALAACTAELSRRENAAEMSRALAALS